MDTSRHIFKSDGQDETDMLLLMQLKIDLLISPERLEG